VLHVGEWEAQNKTHLANDCVAIIEDLDTTVREYTTVGEVLGDWLFVLRVCVLFYYVYILEQHYFMTLTIGTTTLNMTVLTLCRN